MQYFFSSFSDDIIPTDTLILAVSGGVDSMVLLDLVLQVHPHDRIIVGHVDHCLRGSESDGDREFVMETCARIGVRCEMTRIDITERSRESHMGIEATARRERYQFLRGLRDSYSARYIVTAHHADDQMETILQNLIKGAKERGLSGMQIVSGDLYRPLLSIPKSEIQSYAGARHIHYREDSTNTDTHYDRNRIRHEIVPVLRSMHPSIHETIGELGAYMGEFREFIDRRVESWFHAQELMTQEENAFLIRYFEIEAPFFQRELLVALYASAHGGSTQGLSGGGIREMQRFILEGSNSYGIKDIKNLHLERRGERVLYSAIQ